MHNSVRNMKMIYIFEIVEIIYALSIVFVSLIASTIAFYIIKRAERIAKTTETTVDDLILNVIEKPVPLGILLVGFYISLTYLTFLSPYEVHLKNLFTIIIIVFGAYILVKVVSVAIKGYGEAVAARTGTKLDNQFLPVFRKLASVFIYLIALIIVARELDIEIAPLVAAMGIGGIAVALALQDSLTNFFAGFYLAMDKPIRVGDFIKIETGDEGFVEEIGWRSSKIRVLSNNLVIVPNSRLAQTKITNYSLRTTDMEIVIPIGVSYDSNLEKVERVTVEVAKDVLANTPGGVKEFEPFIRYNQFGDSNINFSAMLRVWTLVDKYLVTHEFIKALKKRYDEEGIEISYPARKMYIKDQ